MPEQDGNGRNGAAETAGTAVRGAPDLYAKVVDAVDEHAIFALDNDGTIILSNRGAERLTNYRDGEVVGQPFALFSARGDAAEVARLLQGVRNTGTSRQERWWRRRDGGLVWVEEQISPLDGDGFVVVTRDLTARVEQEERSLAGQAREQEGLGRERLLRSELQAAERRASFLAEASSILVATSLDFDSTLKALARLAVSRLADWCLIHAMDEDGGLQLADLAHRDPGQERLLEQVVDAGLTPVWSRLVRSVVQTGQAQVLERLDIPAWFKARNAELLAGLVRGSAMVAPLLGRGVVLGTVTYVATDPERSYDDEDLQLAEELGRRAAIALDNARLYREAQEANRAKADFLAVMSHELRTPLNAIMGYSDLLDAEISGDLSDRQRRQVDRIRASARHLLQLIEEILSYARIEAGGEELQLGLADAGEIAREAAAVIEPMAAARQLEFRLMTGPADVAIETDAGKVRQVLVNLLSNAVKFTERGWVELRLEVEDNRLSYHIVDTGVGIPEQDMERIFDPFWQVERPNTRRVGGTGLGLSVSRRYVRLLQGEIEISSHPGRGTHVRVNLPLRITGRR